MRAIVAVGKGNSVRDLVLCSVEMSASSDDSWKAASQHVVALAGIQPPSVSVGVVTKFTLDIEHCAVVAYVAHVRLSVTRSVIPARLGETLW